VNTVRPMAGKDKPAVMSIIRCTPEFKPEEVAVAEEVIDSYLVSLDKSGYCILVTEDGGAVTGYICYGPTPMAEGTWDVYWMAVDPQKKRQGIGKTLMQAVIKAIGESNGRLALIEPSSKDDYENTRRFHISQGFEEVARIKDFYAIGDDMIIFQIRF
jgi:ribosomal protein S18 acetylase RimI-like enzyme